MNSQDQFNRIDGFLKDGSISPVFRKNLKERIKWFLNNDNNYGLTKGTNGKLKIKMFKHDFGQFMRYTEVHRLGSSNIQPFVAKKKIVEDHFMQNYLTRNIYLRM